MFWLLITFKNLNLSAWLRLDEWPSLSNIESLSRTLLIYFDLGLTKFKKDLITKLQNAFIKMQALNYSKKKKEKERCRHLIFVAGLTLGLDILLLYESDGYWVLCGRYLIQSFRVVHSNFDISFGVLDRCFSIIKIPMRICANKCMFAGWSFTKTVITH